MVLFISAIGAVLAMTVGAYEYRGDVLADAEASSFKFIGHEL